MPGLAELCPTCGRLLIVAVPTSTIRQEAALPPGDVEQDVLHDLDTLVVANELAADAEDDQVVVVDGRISEVAVCRCGTAYEDLRSLARLGVLREAVTQP